MIARVPSAVFRRIGSLAQDVEDPAPAPTPAAPAGRYVCEANLGHGGMGSVVRAYDTLLRRRVALKRLTRPPEDAEARARFLREASLAARLRHPGLVSILDVGACDGGAYYTMDLIEGPALLTLMGGDPREAVRVIAEAARALHFAHQRGVIHRDVKPTNILLRPDGHPVVVDFGIAREAAGETAMTSFGQVLGTPAYMSPEQAMGLVEEIDARTDVYGLGATLYHLLTGCPPHDGANAASVVQAVLAHDPRRPREIRPSIPIEVEAIIAKALERDRRLRYASAEALARDLEAFIEGRPVLAAPLTRPRRLARWVRRNRNRAGLALVLLFALGFCAAAWARRPGTALEQAAREVSEAHAILAEDRVEERRGHLEAAAQLAQAALDQAPDSTPAAVLLARVQMDLGDADQAVAALTKLAARGVPSLDFDLLRARFRSALRRYCFTRCSDFQAAKAGIAEAAARVQASAAWDGAREQALLLSRAIDADMQVALPLPDPSSGRLCPEACFVYGLAYDEDGNHAAAEQYLRRAVESDPLYIEAWLWLGGVLLEEGRVDEAERIFVWADRTGRPDTQMSFRLLRAGCRIRVGDLDGAIALFPTTDIVSVSSYALLEVATAHLLAGRTEAALATAAILLSREEETDPVALCQAHYVRACALATQDADAALGDLEDALRTARQADLLLDRPAHGWPDEGFEPGWKRSSFFFPLLLTRRAVTTDPLLVPLHTHARWQGAILPLLAEK